MNVLKRHRLALGLTQRQLGRRVGVAQSSIQQWENGSGLPSARFFPKLAGVFEIDPVDLTRLVAPDKQKPTPATAGA